MKNEKLVYGLGGVIIGLVVMSIIGSFGRMNMMHRMDRDMMKMDHGSMSMGSMMMDMNKSLEGKTGDEFDKAFLSEMITHHEGAVSMAKKVLETSKKPELIKLANDIISAQNKEIEMMKAWQTKWFK